MTEKTPENEVTEETQKPMNPVKRFRITAYAGSIMLGFGIGFGMGTFRATITGIMIVCGICAVIDSICCVCRYYDIQ